MSDLTDEELHRIAHPSRFTWDVAPTPRETTMAVEAIRHRAMVKRLEAWAEQLEGEPNVAPFVSQFIAAQLRSRMRAP